MNNDEQKQSDREFERRQRNNAKAKRHRDKLASRPIPPCDGVQVCSVCLIEKHLSEFNRKITQKSGFQPFCRLCTKDINKEQYFKHNWGLTLNELQVWKDSQDNRCACCKQPCDSLKIDHHHKTGIIRELLCSPCNVAIGYLNDDAKRVEQILDYLKKHVGAMNPDMPNARKCLRPDRTSYSGRTRKAKR